MVKEYSYKNDKDKVLSKHFKVGEFASIDNRGNKLTTDKILIDDNLVIMLEKLYDYLDNLYGIKSILITSGYRSVDFEMSLAGGVANGQHPKGTAVDIIVNKKSGGSVDSKLVCCASETVGFNGIGYGGTYTHIDVRSSKSYFDETNGKTGISSFYSYFNIAKPNNNNPITTNNKYKVGDIVTINGVYISSDSNDKLTPRITTGTITKIVNNAKNPYLLNDGNIGWVNDSVITNNNVYLSNLSYKGTSLVDALNEIKVDSSYSYRSKLATKNNISNYKGTSEQNTTMLNLLKKGKLIKA